jgi:glutaryl-CoA transferase
MSTPPGPWPLVSGGEWPAPHEAPAEGPLAGLRVLDLSRVLAGPFATMLLGDLGADVIKIESPEGDCTRHWGPPFIGDTAAYYFAANRNKRSVVLDLKSKGDLAVVWRLTAAADVVIENLRSDSAARLRLDYDQIVRRNRDCVVCTISGFARGSAREADPAYDVVVQAAGGMMGITGIEGMPPVKVGVAIADLMAGLYATTAILAALRGRDEGRGGVHIEVPLLDVQIAGLVNQSMNWLAAGVNPGRMGSDHPNVAPYGAYATKTGYIVVAVGTDPQFARLARSVARPEWCTDPRFATNVERVARRDEMRSTLEMVLSDKSAAEWIAILREAGVPCAEVRDVAQVFADGDVTQRLVRTVSHPRLGDLPQVLSPIRLDGHPPEIRLAPPDLGEHTEEVLATLAASTPAPDSSNG